MADEIDLHGMRHAEAKLAVEEYILLNEPPYKIITGNSIRMKEIVQEILKQHGIKGIEFGPKILAG
jgi:hypothetical protein